MYAVLITLGGYGTFTHKLKFSTRYVICAAHLFKVPTSLQEGHSRPVYNICFHPDGSLAVTRFGTVSSLPQTTQMLFVCLLVCFLLQWHGWVWPTVGPEVWKVCAVARQPPQRGPWPGHFPKWVQGLLLLGWKECPPCLFRYHVGTGGDDHTVDIWDIRRKGRIYTIPAHTNLVSHLKFQGKGVGQGLAVVWWWVELVGVVRSWFICVVFFLR